MIIGEKGVKMDTTKVEAIMSWLMLKCMKDVQAFLGLTNFYHCFIQDFSKISTPLNNLTCKETVWRLGETQQKVFDELKRRFVGGPILVAADYTHPLCVESDTSDFATGAVFVRGTPKFQYSNSATLQLMRHFAISATLCNHLPKKLH